MTNIKTDVAKIFDLKTEDLALKPSLKFHLDCIRFFNGSEVVEMDQYTYSYPNPEVKRDKVNGANLWEAYLRKSRNYYQCQTEARILQQNSERLGQIIGSYRHFIDLGPGPAYSVLHKTLPLLRETQNLTGYSCIDICPRYLDNAVQTVTSAFPGLPTEDVCADFFYDFDTLTAKFKKHRSLVLSLVGNTIANINEDANIDYPVNTLYVLNKLRRSVRPGTKFIIGHDINQDKDSIISSYDDNLFAQHTLNIFHRIKRDLGLENFDPEAFDMHIEWHPEKYCLSIYAIPTKIQRINILGKEIFIECSKKLHITSSYKYPLHLFEELGTKAGFQPLEIFTDENGLMAVHVWQAN